MLVALGGALIRVILGTGFPVTFQNKRTISEAVVTAIALVWWQLVAYGFIKRHTYPVSAPRR